MCTNVELLVPASLVFTSDSSDVWLSMEEIEEKDEADTDDCDWLERERFSTKFPMQLRMSAPWGDGFS